MLYGETLETLSLKLRMWLRGRTVSYSGILKMLTSALKQEKQIGGINFWKKEMVVHLKQVNTTKRNPVDS